MPTLPLELTSLIVGFAPLFSKPVFKRVQVLIVGAILSPGKRTVTAALRVCGLSTDKHFQNYHRVLSRAVWSSLSASRILLSLLVAAFAPDGVLVMGLDDTIERRRGEQIKARGIYRDPVRSSRSHFVKASGLRWLSLMLLVPIPWAGRIWALPFLTALCPSERYYKERGRAHQKLTERARQQLLVVKRWLPEREIVVVADSSFAALELLEAVRAEVTVITRLRMDAALYEPAPVRVAGQRGRPRKKGARLPTLKQIVDAPQTVWQCVSVNHWYGEAERTVEIASGTCVWYHTGMPVVPIKWVLVRDPHEKFETQAFLCTKVEAMPAQILVWFVQRWTIEVTFEEARAHLGVETRAAMVGQSDSAHDACCLRALLGRHTAGGALAGDAEPAGAPCRVVRQRECDLLGHDCLCETLFVDSSAFSDVGNCNRDDKNPTLISGTPDRDALLCSLNG